MITAYTRTDGRIEAATLTEKNALPQNLCWLDLDTPSDTEREAVAGWLGVAVPSQAEMEEIEVSSRLYVENEVIYLTATLLVGADSPEPELADLSLIVTKQHLIITRFAEPKSIAIFTARAVAHPALAADAEHAVLNLLDAIADRTADILEMTGRQVNRLSQQIFPKPTATLQAAKPAPLKDMLYSIGRIGDMLHRNYHSINGLIRMTVFLAQALHGRLSPDQVTLLRSLQSDLKSLHDHAGFMIQETTFLLDATLGQINSEQNDIFRSLMLISSLFLPSSLLAGIYGMNFTHLPGLESPWWIWGVFGLMAFSALTALVYFKRRGWW